MKQRLLFSLLVLLFSTGMIAAPANFTSGMIIIDPGQSAQLDHNLGALPAFVNCFTVDGNGLATEAPDIMFAPCDQSPYAIEILVDYRHIVVYNPHAYSVTVIVTAER